MSCLLVVLPGWLLASRLKLDPLAKLFVAAVAGFTGIYLLAFGAYLTSIPLSIPAAIFIGLSVLSLFGIYRQRKDVPIGGLFAWLGLAVWILAWQSQIVTYGASTWFGDWYEHYERSIFFLYHQPAETKFLSGLWSVPARAPLFNSVIALLMPLLGDGFSDFQVFATLLNTFMVLPMALLLRDMGRLSQRAALFWSVALFALAPFAFEQEIFTWTKAFAYAFILGGICFYRSGLAQNRQWLTGGSFLVFTVGILAHYLTLPFILFFALHFFYTVFRRSWGWRVPIFSAVGCLGLVWTWGVYLLLTFGIEQTMTANSTFSGYGQTLPGPYGQLASHGTIFLGNLVTTTLPYTWRLGWEGFGAAPALVQRDPRLPVDLSAAPNLQTEWFAALSNNPSTLLGMLGYAGMIGVILGIARSLRQKHVPNEAAIGKTFWFFFFAIGIPLNILLSSDYAPHGTGHLNLGPYACLIAIWLFRTLRDFPLWVRSSLLALFLIESALTTGAILYLQERPVPLVKQGEQFSLTTPGLPLSPLYVNNYILKLNTNAHFLSDRLGDLKGPFLFIALAVSMSLFVILKPVRKNEV